MSAVGRDKHTPPPSRDGGWLYTAAEWLIAIAVTAYLMHAMLNHIDERREHRTEHASEEHR